jgi:hypothetical protein
MKDKTQFQQIKKKIILVLSKYKIKRAGYVEEFSKGLSKKE